MINCESGVSHGNSGERAIVLNWIEVILAENKREQCRIDIIRMIQVAIIDVEILACERILFSSRRFLNGYFTVG